ncbi:MAG: hypothetical protein WCG26_08765, partial [Chloroflexales bacterium]
MITIIADPYQYHRAPAEALHARGVSDYVPTRRAIRRALDDGQPLTIHVTHRLLLHWLADLLDYAGIQWEYVAPEADYRRLFGRDPTQLFTPELLLRLDIASMSAPPPERASEPVGWILGQRLHPLWSFPQGSAAHLAQLLSWALTHSDPLESYLHPLMQQRLTVWADADPVYARLRAGSLGTDATNLMRCVALQRYEPAWLRAHGLDGLVPDTLVHGGDHRQQVFHHEAHEAHEGRTTADDAPCAPRTAAQPDRQFQNPVLALPSTLWLAALRELAPALERYWRERIAQATPTAAFVHAAVERMSGWSSTELHAIEAVLQRDASLLEQALIQTLRRRFADLPDAAVTLDELEGLVPPTQPMLPQEAWSDAQWLRWATNEYMPYFTWTVRANQPREHQQACALAYETWLAQRYPQWLTSVGSPLITRQFTLLRDLLSAQANTVVVWLVVDGMTRWQGRILQDICRHQGLYPQRYEAGVALLPSLTDISKRALVTGMAISEPPRGSIAQAAREKLERAGVRGFVGYNADAALEILRGAEPPVPGGTRDVPYTGEQNERLMLDVYAP